MFLWKLTADPAPSQPEVAAALEQIFQSPAWIERQGGDISWSVRPEWSDALLDPQGRLRIQQWRAEGRVSIIKQGPHRVVYKVALAEPFGNVYIKRNRADTLRARVRQYLRRGKGRNEARRAVRLAASGVPTITPIALGEQRRHGLLRDNYLISPEIPGALPLDRFLAEQLPLIPADRRPYVRRRLAESLGDLTARLHEGHYVHIDFHPGNILVRMDDAGEPVLAMIDLDALRIRQDMDWKTVARNLSLLNHSAWGHAARSERQRFLHAYLKRRGTKPPDVRAFSNEVEEESRIWAERLWRRTGRRCTRTNKYFVTTQGPHSWAVASRDVDPSLLADLLIDPDAPFQAPDAHLIKTSRTTTVTEIPLPFQGKILPVIYKRFNRKKWLDPLLTLFRPSRAWRAWRNAQHLTVRGIPTPRNLAVIARTGQKPRWLFHGGCPRETYLVTLKAEPSVTLYDHVHQDLPLLPEPQRKRRLDELTESLARLIRLMHERSLSHRDLKSANILVENPSNFDASPQLSLIDLVGVSLERPLTQSRRVQNLARLHLSLQTAPDRTRTRTLRFLRIYLTWSGQDPSHWKVLWRQVEEAASRKVAQNLRRDRILS